MQIYSINRRITSIHVLGIIILVMIVAGSLLIRNAVVVDPVTSADNK
ncbi:hypothetical protein NV379_18860 [Paenibacillus sp. N1-5-1-14]|nr:hypothetical protein [Paenibacillus radicibacter]MCR8644719.1 hypothetical protein [Paenibacillus radicibacter]